MGKNLNLKIFIILALVTVSVYQLVPSIKYHLRTKEERAKVEETNPEAYKGAIKLGLDLQGGIRFVLQIDMSKLSEDQKKDAANRALEVIRNRVDQFGVAEPIIQKQGDDRIIIELPGFSDVERAKKMVGTTALLEFKMVREAEYVGPALEAVDRYLKRSGMSDSLKTTGTGAVAATAAIPPDSSKKSKPDSAAQELFGAAATLASDTAGLTDEEKTAQAELKQTELDKPFTSLLVKADYDIAVPKKNIPRVKAILESVVRNNVLVSGVEFAWGSELEGQPGQEHKRLYLLKSTSELNGSYLSDAKSSISQGGMNSGAVVNMTLTSEGARRFSKITGANIEKRMAIVLDGQIYSAPVIRSKIPNGSAEISGMANLEEARDLAIVLRAGALPAPMEIIEERTVGPTLGQDSINQSIKATFIAMLLIMFVMVLFYKLSGFIAIFALFLNILFLTSILAGLGFTLTLPGIAGIILTVGVAVDANVLINERIREELRLGKTIRAAIDQGYARAFRAIFDSNITSIITGLILYYYGTGPIMGFAVTLVIGLLVSMVTSIWVTHIIYNFFTIKYNVQKLSI
ncbi:MAG: protein translocase subunit SecD [Fibrobacterota bacterium]